MWLVNGEGGVTGRNNQTWAWYQLLNTLWYVDLKFFLSIDNSTVMKFNFSFQYQISSAFKHQTSQ